MLSPTPARSILLVLGTAVLFGCVWLSSIPLAYLRASPPSLLIKPRSLSFDVSESEVVSNSSMLVVRQALPPGECTKSIPCVNGACCNGQFCGYGPSYCSSSNCTSDCNAVAQCGEFAELSGSKCPLNVCCDKYGFCGTTDEFCGAGCQSGCELNPSPPASSVHNLFQRVIGYYEAWSSTSKCHKVLPTDLPLSALTHLNYAFAYITPGSYQITTMDATTPESTWSETASCKQYNPSLKVFVSIGGWTFSDNDTATQPLFGEISASATDRETFANNVLSFLTGYGFDGVDIDWEYPGAPDRGGSKEDTENFVLLLEALRSKFDSSGLSLGISFTAPSSYWYLQYFDMPGLLKWANWVNFMTYDLHGVWDATDIWIGNIVQAHTNLTEIQEAAELLWRNDVNPADVSLGFGFYGRSFQLSDSSCSSPGCPFSGAGAAGPCTATPGILDWYEIQALLAQNSLQPVHDSSAGVMYVVYGDGDQWVSYDDAQTFQQKVQWANSVGIGGAMIWASDADTSDYSAHAALLGTSFQHVDTSDTLGKASKLSVAHNLAGSTGQNCEYGIPQYPMSAAYCPKGEGLIPVAYEWRTNYRDPLQPTNFAPFCCPANSAPTACVWRGVGPNCAGTCMQGETQLSSTTFGGFPSDVFSKSACYTGQKVLCCQASLYSQALGSCVFTECGGPSCSGQFPNELAEWYNFAGCPGNAPPTIVRRYCCGSPSPLQKCTWRGTPLACTDNACLQGEVKVADAAAGDSEDTCAGSGVKNLCCTATSGPPSVPQSCDNNNLCSTLVSCDQDADLVPAYVPPLSTTTINKRGKRDSISDPTFAQLDKRQLTGNQRSFTVLSTLAVTLDLISPQYPRASDLWPLVTRAGSSLAQYVFVVPDASTCVGNVLQATAVSSLGGLLPAGVSTEHIFDLQFGKLFLIYAMAGTLPNSARRWASRTYDYTFFTGGIGASSNLFFNRVGVLSANLPPVSPSSPVITSMAGRLMEALGSSTNLDNFVLLDQPTNAVKSLLVQMKAPVALDTFTALAKAGFAGDEASQTAMLASLGKVTAVFAYWNNNLIQTRFNNIYNSVYKQLGIIALVYTPFKGLDSLWPEFVENLMIQVAANAQNWAYGLAQAAYEIYRCDSADQSTNQQAVCALLQTFQTTIPDLYVGGYDPTPGGFVNNPSVLSFPPGLGQS